MSELPDLIKKIKKKINEVEETLSELKGLLEELEGKGKKKGKST